MRSDLSTGNRKFLEWNQLYTNLSYLHKTWYTHEKEGETNHCPHHHSPEAAAQILWVVVENGSDNGLNVTKLKCGKVRPLCVYGRGVYY
jgi:hypothetical protein